MRLVPARCTHCNSKYTWQASGINQIRRPASDKHCPDCYEAIAKTLEKIPIKFESRWVYTDEVSLEILKHWVNDKRIEHSQPGSMPYMVRVFPEIVTQDGKTRTETRQISGNDRHYRWRIWKEDGRVDYIRVKKEFNIQKNEITGYWK